MVNDYSKLQFYYPDYEVYANGVLHNSSAQAIMTASSNGTIIIGASTSGSNVQNFVGQIAITRIYNRDLPASEITANFDSEKSRFGF